MQESGNRMLAHVVYDLQPEVGQRAAGERNAVACDALEQLAVVLNVDAVVDALGVQQIERIAIYAAGPSSPACATQCQPKSLARAN